jgi:hypothetical protein
MGSESEEDVEMPRQPRHSRIKCALPRSLMLPPLLPAPSAPPRPTSCAAA